MAALFASTGSFLQTIKPEFGKLPGTGGQIREEQRKFIRYNHIAANLIVFHSTVSMTRVLQQLVDEGYPVTKEILARFSPCKIGHINRFGQIEMRFDRPPDPLIEDLRL
jgi:hypothetical protein